MANILITGSNGQLGSELREIEKGDDNITFFTDVSELDITNSVAVEKFVATNNIQIIINCAAYTAVDNAEDNQDIAYNVNAKAPQILAETSALFGATLIHISTDYVFDGLGYKPYLESDTPNPQGIYGKSKLLGEKAIMESGCKYFIIRTAWLYSCYGNNFVKTIIKYSKQKDALNVVFDQIGTPTYAKDLANTIIGITNKISCFKGDLSGLYGIYHYTNEGVCSWYDFALEITNLIENKNCTINPVTTDKYPTKATRPPFSLLDKSKIKEKFGIKIPYWRDSLKHCIDNLNRM